MNQPDDNIQLPAVDPMAMSQPSQGSTPNNAGAANNDGQVVVPHYNQQHTALPSYSQDTPAVAGDVDLIEKEWVEKAKNIVNSTLGDPHAQAEKISQMKADYIQKRYNKTIRSEEK